MEIAETTKEKTNFHSLLNNLLFAVYNHDALVVVAYVLFVRIVARIIGFRHMDSLTTFCEKFGGAKLFFKRRFD